MSSPVSQPNPLTNLRQRVADHWKEFRPTMWRDLERSGALTESLSQAVELTKSAYHDAVDSGLSQDQAWELVREEWAFLPEDRQSPTPPSFQPRK